MRALAWNEALQMSVFESSCLCDLSVPPAATQTVEWLQEPSQLPVLCSTQQCKALPA